MAKPRHIWRHLRRNPGALLGLVVLVGVILLVSAGPLIWRIDPTRLDIAARNQGAGLGHPLGTDQLGRDLLARLMAGGRVTLALGTVAAAITMSIGCAIGSLAGWFRALDGPLMRLADLFLALPLLPLLLLATALFRDALAQAVGPGAGSFVLIVAAIGLTSWMPVARVLRAEVLGLRGREFIRAAIAMGVGPGRMIARHIWPNTGPAILVSATLALAQAIMLESALSFLGMGFAPDYPTWGRMLHDAMDLMGLYPARALLPGLMISMTLLAVNAVAEGVRDALDPRARR